MSKTLPTLVWAAIATAAVVATTTAIQLDKRHNAQVRLAPGRAIPAVSVLVVMTTMVVVSALIGFRRQRLGLVGLSLVSIGASLAWWLLDDHRLAGPVILMVTSRHGLHLSDPFAALPALAGTLVVARLLWATSRVQAWWAEVRSR